MRLLYVDSVGEQSKGVLSHKNVLTTHRFVGNFDVLKEAAKALGYEFILWNGKVYRACGVETLYTEKDIQ